MTNRFKGKVAFVTGGSRGIGRGITEWFAEEGAKVAIVDINAEALQEAADVFEDNGYDYYTKNVNIVHSEEVETAMDEVVERFGSLDILVNNAGVIRDNMLFKMTNEDWQQVMDVHLKGSFNATRAAQKYMVKNRFGRIINISSTSALGNRGQANYSTSYSQYSCLGKTKLMKREIN